MGKKREKRYGKKKNQYLNMQYSYMQFIINVAKVSVIFKNYYFTSSD